MERKSYFGKGVALFVLLLSLCRIANAIGPVEAEKYFIQGRKSPEFVLKNLINFSKKEARLSDFKNKWVILDFWGLGCSSCFESFPHMNALQKDYKENIQVIMIGLEDPKNLIRSVYRKYEEKESLELMVSFDSSIFKRFDIYSCPHIIIIDPKGIVRAITFKLTSESMGLLLQGLSPYLPHTYTRYSKQKEEKYVFPYDDSRPLLLNNNGGADSNFIYRTLIAEWNEHMRPYGGSYNIERSINATGGLQIIAHTLREMYNLAYFDFLGPIATYDSNYGKVFHEPLLQISDTTLFSNLREDGSLRRYCLSLVVSRKNRAVNWYKKVLQHTLEDYFGYDVAIETRKMPCWELHFKNDSSIIKLKTKATKLSLSGDPTQLICKNIPISTLVKILAGKYSQELSFVDCTNYSGNIDISIHALLSSFDDFRLGLEREGIILKKEEREMKVIVIRDPVKN